MEYTQALAASLARAQERIRGTFIELIGLRIIEVTSERAVAEMLFIPQLQQLTGVFHAGALLTLADTTATLACMYWSSGTIDGSAEQFPLTIQLSTNFIRNTNQGTVRAEATPAHRGRTTMVVETRVSDAARQLLIIVTTTHLLVGRSTA
jgi:1,4-dihydroxy-2-naphthoyl-CoA hydrolase